MREDQSTYWSLISHGGCIIIRFTILVLGRHRGSKGDKLWEAKADYSLTGSSLGAPIRDCLKGERAFLAVFFFSHLCFSSGFGVGRMTNWLFQDLAWLDDII